jgi:hypothetical protein
MLPLRLQTMLLQLQAMPLHIVANNTNTTIITNTANIIDLKILLKLNVIVLATVFAPPLPVILRLGIDVIVLEVGMIHSPLLFCRGVVEKAKAS